MGCFCFFGPYQLLVLLETLFLFKGMIGNMFFTVSKAVIVPVRMFFAKLPRSNFLALKNWNILIDKAPYFYMQVFYSWTSSLF